MAVADNSVRWYHWMQAGSPQLNGLAGSKIALLDAVLVNGFGVSSVDSAVVTANECVLTISAGHSQIKDGVVRVSGVTAPAALNGDWKVKSITGSTVRFDTEGISDQTATGTIQAKVAPLGWAKPFAGTNLAAYKPSDGTANGHYLRVDDTATLTPRVRGYETMSDVNTGTGLFPLDTQVSGGLWWGKSSTADATNRPWMLFGDGKLFHLWVSPNLATSVAQPTGGEFMTFGEGIKKLSTDVYGTYLNGGISSGSIVSSNGSYSSVSKPGNTGMYNFAPRTFFNLSTSENCEMRADFILGWNTQIYSGSTSLRPFPPLDGKISLWRIKWMSPFAAGSAVGEINVGKERATVPGVYVFDCGVAPILNTFDDLPAVPELPNRRVMIVRSDPLLSQTPVAVAIDLTGPWR